MPAERELLRLVDDSHAAAAEDGLDLVAGHGNRSARTLRLRARLLRGRDCHIDGREGVVGKSAGSDIGGNVRARWSGARFVVGGTEGIVRFCRRHRSPSFEQPRVEGGILPSCDTSDHSEVWRAKRVMPDMGG